MSNDADHGSSNNGVLSSPSGQNEQLGVAELQTLKRTVAAFEAKGDPTRCAVEMTYTDHLQNK